MPLGAVRGPLVAAPRHGVDAVVAGRRGAAVLGRAAGAAVAGRRPLVGALELAAVGRGLVRARRRVVVEVEVVARVVGVAVRVVDVRRRRRLADLPGVVGADPGRAHGRPRRVEVRADGREAEAVGAADDGVVRAAAGRGALLLRVLLGDEGDVDAVGRVLEVAVAREVRPVEVAGPVGRRAPREALAVGLGVALGLARRLGVDALHELAVDHVRRAAVAAARAEADHLVLGRHLAARDACRGRDAVARVGRAKRARGCNCARLSPVPILRHHTDRDASK